MDFNDLAYKYALHNAVKFSGKADEKSVLGRIMREHPEARQQSDMIKAIVASEVNKANALKPEEQVSILEKIAPELLEEKKRPEAEKEKDIFAFMGIREGDYVQTAFPPEPSKYPHIGHAKAIMLNYLLAKRYSGKFTLRFEDTNPKLAKKEFYDIHLENYKWLGIEPDKIDYASSHMQEIYIFAEELIKKEKAYVCHCDTETMRDKRAKGEDCNCRSQPAKKNLQAWNDMFLMKEGEAVLRMKIDMQHANTTMRDPVIMRIIDGEHPLTGKRFRIWPNYDFENSVMDGLERISHRLRTKEFELRNELQRLIQKELGFDETRISEFARFNLEGVESSGRIIREKIENKELLGWDDPSLTTLVALRRRGFLPEAIRNFSVSTGITKAEATLTWDDLIVQNRRLLDPIADRHFFVEGPVEIKIEHAPEICSHLKLHPDNKEKGTRELRSSGIFYIAKNDYDSLQDNALYRLMDCLNFKKQHGIFHFDSKEVAKYKEGGKKIMHWLPKSPGLVHVEVLMPDKRIAKGLAEEGIKNLEAGAIIQFERFGFCKLDRISDDKKTFYFWYTHK